MNTIQSLPVSQIRPNPENPRKKMNESELAELSQSIKSIGLLQPITVRMQVITVDDCPVEDIYYEIVCGHRRFEAVKLAGLEEIPCIVRALSDDEAYEIMVTENLQRKDVDPFDEAAAFTALKNRGYDTDALAEKFGKSKSYVFSRIKLSSLIPEFVKKYEDGAVDFSHCLILARLDSGFQMKLLNERYSGGYSDLSGKSVKELRFAISNLGMSLKGALFNTDACINCPKNAGCASLFLDINKATCTDVECYSQKFLDVVYPKFEKVRQDNPDFFICDNWDLSRINSPWEKKLLEKLRKEGFKFVKGEIYDRKRLNESRDERFNIDHPEICAFDFRWNGFLGPKEERKPNNCAQHKWKSDYTLNNLANTREEYTKELANEIAFDSIFNADLTCKVVSVESLLRAMLLYMIPNDDNEETAARLGINDVHDVEEVRTAVNAMSPHKVNITVAQLFSQVIDGSYDVTIMQQIFPEAFEGVQEKAEKEFMEKARNCWNGYDEVTDEMIEEDLAARIKKEDGKS